MTLASFKHEQILLKMASLFAWCIVGISLGDAQTVQHIGIKGGVVLASQRWHYTQMDWTLDNLYRTGIDVGLFAEWSFVAPVSLLTEMHVVQKGMKERAMLITEASPDGTGASVELTPEVDYLSFPLLIKYRTPFSAGDLYGIFGPHIAFLIAKKNDGFSLVMDRFSKVDVGVSLGGGWETTALTGSPVGIEARFSPGLYHIYSTPLLTVSNTSFEVLLTAAF